MTHRRGQSIVEARRVNVWDEGDRNVEDVAQWSGGEPAADGVRLKTDAGEVVVHDGDWIVKCEAMIQWHPADMFAVMYEPI